MPSRAAALILGERPRYIQEPVPVVFPDEAEVPVAQRHMDVRILLYQLLVDYLGLEFTVGSDQFVYYAADDPRQSVAPDAFVRVEPRGERIRSWKTWERGAPEVAVEIAGDSDAPEPSVEEKLGRYRRLGVSELVRFDLQAPAGSRLRVWDRVEGDLVEREVAGERAPSLVLSLVWVVAPAKGYEAALRIAEPESGTLVVTRAEGRLAEATARGAAEAALGMESRARKAAEDRVAELEAELRRRGGA